ncbi:MAG: DUF547 domain-containing protein [Gemmatales bacterium]|nr:MAG: DUF547 domain-containing protein [Gemmatales bacterium]
MFCISRLCCVSVLLWGSVCVLAQGAETGGPNDFDYILKKYVKGDFFDYASLAKNQDDRNRLAAFLRWQANAKIDEMSREEQIAFYINAYNACCIKAILDHYPVHSPKDIPGFFDKIKFRVAGEELTISEIEYDRLIARYKDMRAHFAVVCADRGCLPLKKGIYTGKTLDADLEAAAKRFVGSDQQFKIDREKGEVWVSKIFDWYGPKFTKDPKRPAKKPELFLKYWLAEPDRKYLESGSYRLRFFDWDWTLNEKIEKK